MRHIDRRADRRAAKPVDGGTCDAVGKTSRHRCPPGDIPHALVGRVHTPGHDVFDLIKADADALTRALHRHAEQLDGPDV